MGKKVLSAILAVIVCAAAWGCTGPVSEPVQESFVATVLEINGDTVLVEPVEGEPERRSADKITFCVAGFEDIGASVGDAVQITYTGQIMESYPAQIHATKWEMAKNKRHLEYTEIWLDKQTAQKQDNDLFDHIIITEIYSNCFFAVTAIPLPWQIKLNGQLPEQWCVGDQVQATYENVYRDSEKNRIEADFSNIIASDWQPDPMACYKPVIYLYPEEEMQVSVKLALSGGLTCTYPAYENGWQVTAKPDGTLTDAKGQTFHYLYWEGVTDARWDLTEGFCVRGADTAQFLEKALEKLGLNRREANEMIVYWLPQMQENPYNIVSFQREVYTEAAKLDVIPAPDTLIRVFMTFKASETPVQLPAQELTAPERKGFTVIEWGGTEIS